MKILPNNVAVTGSSHHAEWCANGLVHDRWFADEVLRNVKPGDTIVEGGAHIGSLTRAFIDYGCNVIAFEPNPDAVKCLRHNCPEAAVIAAALGESKSQGWLHISENSGASCLSSEGTVVPVVKLDDEVTGPVHLIKLDVEGFEVRALSGGINLILEYRPVIVCEVQRHLLSYQGTNPAELFGALNGLGYGVSIIQPDCSWNSEQYDVLALPR